MSPGNEPRIVVGVGASAGGLEAFKQLLGALPDDSGMAFLLVQHLDPNHESLLAELLTPLTGMAVKDADQGLRLEPDTVYIIRPDTALAVKDGRIELSQPTLHRGVRLPVNHLFRSLAKEYGPRSAGIVLSGAGSDGSAGVRDIKGVGGLIIAEDPEDCGQPGMPQSAIATGVVDLVLKIDDMPRALARFAAMPPAAAPEQAKDDNRNERSALRPEDLSEAAISRLAAVLEAQMKFDLRVYKTATIGRRMLRRMVLSGFDSVNRYLDHLREDPGEQQRLLRDLLISVTEFFRDPEAYETLRQKVIEPMVAGSAAGATLRVWVAGCATGEETYSIAMEFLEAIESLDKRLSLQVFATDVDQDAVQVARTAIYSPSIADHVSKRRLATYFKPLEGQGYQVRPHLRDMVSFAVHDLTKDPPFSRMNLVSCRNVLIYLTSEAQKHVLKALHFALVPEGHLFLSTSESPGAQRDLFATVSKSQRIYRKVGTTPPMSVSRSRKKPQQVGAAVQAPDGPVRRRPAAGDLARRAVLAAIVPPTLVVAEDGTVLFSHGELSPYIRIPEGDNPRFVLGSVLRAEIATRVRGVLYKCRRTQEAQFALSSPDGASPRVRIGARLASSLGEDIVILTFEELPDEAVVTLAEDAADADENIVTQLENELEATRDDLSNTVEELETTNEELRSSNEESMSMNEELQSTNEELEATTEELRSLNEELTTVNAQLREKVEQLESAHDDLTNFFSSTKVATIFLDDGLCIKRLTPAAQEFLGIDQGDTGRYVEDIARELLQHDLAADAKAVLDHLTPKTREIHTQTGKWVTRLVLPYRTESRKIEGVVVTFTDVTDLRTANRELNKKNRRLEVAWEAARGGVLEHSIPPDDSTYVSEQWAQVLGYGLSDLPDSGQLLSWLSQRVHPDDREHFDEAYRKLTTGELDKYALEVRLRHRAGHWIWVRKISRVMDRDEKDRPRHLLRMMINITESKEVEASLRESEARFREMADGLPLLVWVHDEAGNQEFVNQTFCEFFGVSREEMKGGRWQMLVHPDDNEKYTREFYASLSEKRPFHGEARAQCHDGSWRWLESWGRPRVGSDGQFRGFIGTSADVTDRHHLEKILSESEKRFRTLADNITQLVWTCDRLGHATWFNQRWYEFTGKTWEEMKGDQWKDVAHPDHLSRVNAGLESAEAEGSQWEDTFPLRGRDGEYRWFLSRAVPIHDEQNNVVRWFGTNTDITALREVEQKLLQADQQKDEFLAMLGHELRNPLAAIRTAAELIKVHARKYPELAKPQQVLERQTVHMTTILDGLLDIARIVSGKVQITPSPLDFAEVCEEVLADVTGSVTDRELDIQADISPEPIWVEGDRVRLAQVVSNLLSNAVKYTDDGGSIHLALSRDNGSAVLRLTDTGIGIETGLLPRVFEIFQQSEQSIDRSQGGLGLGLALVKSLVGLHGGSVEAHSDGPEKGAEFVVRLPLTLPQAAETADPREMRPPDGLHILVIEDNEDAGDVLKMVLELAGYQVTIANCGKTGIASALEYRPDAVLCDLGLPFGTSGFDVARELRSDDRLKDIPLIALSGYGLAHDKQKSAEAGFDVHLTKPVDLEAVESALVSVLEKAAD